MTRINCVPVTMLLDAHLVAEYKEITRPFGKVAKRINQKTMDKVTIPDSYVLGTGHETFFFDKLKYLWNRREELFMEMRRRGMNPDGVKFNQIQTQLFLEHKRGSKKYWKTWEPTLEDIHLNFARLCKRSKIESVRNELAGGND